MPETLTVMGWISWEDLRHQYRTLIRLQGQSGIDETSKADLKGLAYLVENMFEEGGARI